MTTLQAFPVFKRGSLIVLLVFWLSALTLFAIVRPWPLFVPGVVFGLLVALASAPKWFWNRWTRAIQGRQFLIYFLQVTVTVRLMDEVREIGTPGSDLHSVAGICFDVLYLFVVAATAFYIISALKAYWAARRTASTLAN